MEIRRNLYLNKLISKKDNGLIKIITGIRRCGKSYLLFNLYDQYLKSIGIDETQIIKISLDGGMNDKLRNPIKLGKFIHKLIKDKSKRYYIFLDEIQNVKPVTNRYVHGDMITFIDVLLDLLHENADVYVTGSNSIMLSTDIVTQFRDRGDEVRVYPLSYKEFCDYKQDINC